MRRYARACILTAAMFSTPVFAGEWSDNSLPFDVSLGFLVFTMTLGSCEGPPEMQGSVSCKWGKVGVGSYDAACNLVLDAKEFEVTATIRPRSGTPSGSLYVPGYLTYRTKGITCGGIVPSFAEDLSCTSDSRGLTCGWCWRESCYRGSAEITRKR